MSRLPRLPDGQTVKGNDYNLLAAAIDAGGFSNIQSQTTAQGITGQGLTQNFPPSSGSINPISGSSGTPKTPTGLTLNYGIDYYHQTHDGYIVVTWTPNPVSDNIARYDIYWHKGSDNNLHQLTVGGDVNLARINSVIPGQTYIFAIQAHDTAGRGSQFSMEESITISKDVDPPAIPTGLAATAIGSSIVLTWTEVGSEGISNDLKQYQIAVSTDGGVTYPTVYTVGPGNYWIYDPTVATPFFKIATVDWTGNVSAFSSAVSATVGGTIFGPLTINPGPLTVTGPLIVAGGKPWFDATHPNYAGGAKGDGVTNDRTAIQAALDAANLAGGGVVFLPPSPPSKGYLVNGNPGLTLYPNVTLFGAGKQATFIFYTGAGTGIVFANAQTTPPTATQYAGIQGLTIHGANTGLLGLDWYCVQRSFLRDVRIANFAGVNGTGILVRGYRDTTNPTTASVANQFNHWENVEVAACIINVDMVQQGSFADYNGSVTDNWHHSLNLIGTAGITVTNLRLREKVAQNIFFGTKIVQATTTLLEIRDLDNVFYAPSLEFASTGTGLLLTAASVRTLVVGGLISASSVLTRVTDNGTANQIVGVSDGSANAPAALWKHDVSQGPAPAIAPGVNLGTTGAATITGNDRAGLITLTPGGTGIAAGVQATVTFNKAYSVAPKIVISPVNANGASINAYHPNDLAGTFDISLISAPLAAVAYTYEYMVIQ